MELYYYTISTLFILILTTFSFTKLFTKPNPNKQPPGPKPWPIIGNIHQLGDKPHRFVAKLSKTYGPIMSLKLGNINTIVISSPEIAQEMFLKHDLALSGRNVTDAIKVANHHEYSIVFLPVCDRWRTLRKIITSQLFTHQRLDASQGLRRQKVNELVKYIKQCCETSVPVDIGKVVFTTSLNLLSNTLFSMDLASYENSSSQDFKDLIWNILEEGGRPNVSDFFPFVRVLDLQGVLKRTIGYSNEILGVFQGIIDERMKNSMVVKEDVLATLLKLVQDKELSLDQVKHLLVVSKYYSSLLSSCIPVFFLIFRARSVGGNKRL